MSSSQQTNRYIYLFVLLLCVCMYFCLFVCFVLLLLFFLTTAKNKANAPTWIFILYVVDVICFIVFNWCSNNCVKCLRCHNEWATMNDAQKLTCIKTSLNHTRDFNWRNTSFATCKIFLLFCSFVYFLGLMNFTLFKQQRQKRIERETARPFSEGKYLSYYLFNRKQYK